MLKNTGERVIPGDYSSLDEYVMYLRHVFAYGVAKEKINKNETVLEVGSGEGYGTSSLAKHAEKVTGIDVDAEAIDHANDQYGTENCSFVHYDGTKMPFRSSSVDTAISFQVVEHVEDEASYLSEVYRVLKPGGQFLVATPNRLTRLREGQKPFNEFHLREYEPAEFDELLKTEFKDVESFGVFGTKEIQEMEFERIRKIQKAIRFDPLGLRHHLPSSLKQMLVNLLRKRTRQSTTTTNGFEKNHTVTDFRLSSESIDRSLDLLSICKKPARGAVGDN